ncbi:MAG: hypothetical protein JW800_05420, partial [Candidatus Omnitrophica bacterium]|nr:hypothetical protein [Candidatus Omnitrophota bacterium]
DGEDHEGDPAKMAQRAKDENVRIFCLGIGTLEGELIKTVDQDGNKAFLKDREGNVVKSRLNENALRQIALATGGTYVRSSGADFGLDFIYDEKLSGMERRELKGQMNKVYHERFQIPLAIALLLLFYEPFISEKKKR